MAQNLPLQPSPSAADMPMDPGTIESAGIADQTTARNVGSLGTGLGETGQAGKPDLLAQVTQGAHQTIDRLAAQAEPHVRRLQQGMEHAGEMLDERGTQLRDMGDEWTESLRTTVRENPLTAVAAALALGLLVARLSR